MPYTTFDNNSTCSRLNKVKYNPQEIAGLAGQPPSDEQINEIQNQLKEATTKFHTPGRTYRGIKLNRSFIEQFVNDRYMK